MVDLDRRQELVEFKEFVKLISVHFLLSFKISGNGRFRTRSNNEHSCKNFFDSLDTDQDGMVV